MSTERKILAPERNVWRTVTADDTRVLVDADDYYRAFYAAAERATKYILISGWQFDRGVKLLRGTHAVGRRDGVQLVKFLDRLCERTPSLHIYILAWDFHMIFALEREWMQRLWFHYATNKRLIFRFDDAVADQGSHHQKFVVIDGRESFLGGIDLCEARWDDRRHLSDNPLRTSRGRPSKPYHDVQTQLIGVDPAQTLRELFSERWSRCAGSPIPLPSDGGQDALPGFGPAAPSSVPEVSCLPLGAGPVALSRTDPLPKDGVVRECEHLFVDAIAAAERIIYVETQYFSSTRVRDALIERMQQPERSKLEIVVIVNERAEAIKEEIAVGLRQAKNMELIGETARTTGHAFGLFHTLSDGPGKTQRPTYIHSKLMAVDDRFLTIGSANLTNRSLGVDSELHATWESAGDDASGRDAAANAKLRRRIRRVRVSLLAEHAGLAGVAGVRQLVPVQGLVARLEAIAARPDGRLRKHAPPSQGQKTAMEIVDPEKLPFDPASAKPKHDDACTGHDEPSDHRAWR